MTKDFITVAFGATVIFFQQKKDQLDEFLEIEKYIQALHSLGVKKYTEKM